MTRDVNDWFKCCSWTIKVDWVGIDKFLLCCSCYYYFSCCSYGQLLQLVLLWILWFHTTQILVGTQCTCICWPYTWLCVLWVMRENNRDPSFIIFLPHCLYFPLFYWWVGYCGCLLFLQWKNIYWYIPHLSPSLRP